MCRVWRLGIFTALCGALVCLDTQAAAIVSPTSPSLRASLVTSIGRQLDPDFPLGSVTLEPSLTYMASPLGTLSLRALLDRPLDAYKPWRAPFAELLGIALWHRGNSFDQGFFAQTGAQDLHQWNSEGVQLRQALGWYARWRAFEGMSTEFSVGPYAVLNEFSHRRNGEPFSQWGALEQITVAYQRGPFKIEILVLLVQDWNGRWRNLYSTFERVSWRLAENFSVGLTHQLFRSQVDEVSGALAPIGLFDGRKSRVAGFILWQI
jgi:hypothetical protein